MLFFHQYFFIGFEANYLLPNKLLKRKKPVTVPVSFMLCFLFLKSVSG